MSNPNDPQEPRLTSLDDIRRNDTPFPARQPNAEPVDHGMMTLAVDEMEALKELKLAERLSPAAEAAMRSIVPVAEKWAANGAPSLNRKEVAELYACGLLMAADMAGNEKLEHEIAEATAASFELSDSFNALIAEMDPMPVNALAAEADVQIIDPVHLAAEVDYGTTAFIAAEASMTPLALLAAETELPTVDILAHEMLDVPGKMEMLQAELLNHDLALKKADMTPQEAATIAAALVAVLQD